MHVLSSCPATSFSDPGVCSVSFLCCPNLAQASFRSSSFGKPLCSGGVRLKVLEGARENVDTSLLRLDVTFGVHAQTLLTPLRSETDKERHGVTFPHNDVMLVNILSRCSFFSRALECFFCLSGALWYHSFTPPDQTLPCLTDAYLLSGRHSCRGQDMSFRGVLGLSDTRIVGAVIEKGHRGFFFSPLGHFQAAFNLERSHPQLI